MLKLYSSFIAAFLVGFSSPSWADGSDEYADIHTVGIISAIGDHIAMSQVGVTVFGNSGYKVDTADWGIDRFVTDQVARNLNGRFEIKPVVADIAQIENQSDTPNLAEFAKTLPASNSVDAYIVVHTFLCLEQCAGTPFRLQGLGYVHRKLIFGGTSGLLYAFYGVTVIDAKTGKRIDYGTATFSKGFLGLDMPYASIDDAAWADSLEALTEEQKAMIKAQMFPMIQHSLIGAMENAMLTLPQHS